MRDSLQQGGGRRYLRPVVDMPATKPRRAIRKIGGTGTTYITEAAARKRVPGVPAEVTQVDMTATARVVRSVESRSCGATWSPRSG